MQGDEPTQWSVDNYDGAETWMEMDIIPNEQYRNDAETTTVQWREFRGKLMQVEMETDELLEATETKTGSSKRWQEMKTTVQTLCQEAYQQVEWTRETLREMRGMITSESNRDTNHQHAHVRLNHAVEGHVGITRETRNHEIDIRAECEVEGRPGAEGHDHPQYLQETTYSCSHKPIGQLLDDLSKTPKHRLIVQGQNGPTIIDNPEKVELVPEMDQHHEPSRCQGPDRVKGHVNQTQMEEDHVDHVRERRTQKEENHENQHNERSRAVSQELQLACFTKGKQGKVLIGGRSNDYEPEDEGDNMVCQMTGESWEQLPFPIIIDSGACTSVMPTTWCPHVPTEETTESKNGEYFRAANGEKIFNEGMKIVSLMTREGVTRDMKFTSCEVSKALGSVSQICKAGHRIVFNPPWHEDGSCIEHVQTGEVMWLNEHNGLYVLDSKIAPTNKQTRTKMSRDFGRPGHP